jgi:hypothetical protein
MSTKVLARLTRINRSRKMHMKAHKKALGLSSLNKHELSNQTYSSILAFLLSCPTHHKILVKHRPTQKRWHKHHKPHATKTDTLRRIRRNLSLLITESAAIRIDSLTLQGCTTLPTRHKDHATRPTDHVG